MTRKTGEEVIIVGMKSGEAYNGRKALWLNYDRERKRHRIKVFVNNGLDDEILLVKGENITSDKKFLKVHPEYDTPHKRKRLQTLDEVLKENEEKKKKEKAQKKLFIENPFVKKDGKIVEKPKAKPRATVKKENGHPARTREPEHKWQHVEEKEGVSLAATRKKTSTKKTKKIFFTTSAPRIEKFRSCDRNFSP